LLSEEEGKGLRTDMEQGLAFLDFQSVAAGGNLGDITPAECA
jgi:hypothetical protein